MLVYYVTIIAVLLLASLAQQRDWSTCGGTRIKPSVLYGGKETLHSPDARNFFVSLAAIPLLVAGLRYNVGTDYGAYYRFWGRYADTFWQSLLTLNEPGYRCIAFLTRQMGAQTGAWAVFIAALITVGLSYWTIYRNVGELFLPSVLFLFIGNWIASFNGVRQCLAAAIIFCGYPYLRDRKLIKYVIVVFVAYLFHKSAILMIAPYFIFHWESNWMNTFLMLVGAIVLLNSYELIFNLSGGLLDKQLLFDNMNNYNLAEVNRLRVIANMAPAIFFLGYHFHNRRQHRFSNFSLNLLTLHAVVCLTGMNSPYLTRFNLYTHPFMVIALPDLVKGLPKNTRQLVIFAMIVLYTIMALYEIGKSSALNSFHWIWEA